MRHALWLLAAAAASLFLVWGCSQTPPGQGGNGGTNGGPPSCALPQLTCGTSCVDPATHSAHCGGCNRPCAPGTTCMAGTCACQAGLSSCTTAAGTSCVNLSADIANCGACGVACGLTQGCTTSMCTCPAPSLACGQACVDSTTDVTNCGACGTMCTTGQLCTAGACTCATGRTNCNGACVDLTSDPANCGNCGTICSGATPFCSTSACKATCDPGLAPCATAAGTACVNTMTDLANCGACGTVCPVGQECSGGACGCPAGQSLCNVAGVMQCVNTMGDVNNCGACGTTCMGGQACSAGMCSCTTPGQNFCGGQCLDTSADPLHCGASCAVCAAGETCQAGACACPAGQEPCNGACVAAGQCGTGGTGGGGGSGGSGGAPPMPVDLNCGSVTVPAADVISDFRQTEPLMYATAPRGGTLWYAYGAEDTASAKGASTPGVGSNAFSIDSATPGPCNSGGSLKVSSNGNEGSTGWGVGFGVNLMQDVPGTNPPKKDIYNAQTSGYTGIGFWLRCTPEADFIYIKVVDSANDADVQNPVCSYTSGGTICNQFGIKNATGVDAWTYHKVYFAEALQDWDAATISTGNVNPAALTAFQLQMNTKYTRDGGTRVRNPFTCWVDDVHFVKDAPPRMHANVAPKTCQGGQTAAPGGYFTMGNQIRDCKNNAVKLFKGVARPSLEWDRAGWNITYEDLARIQAWGSNIVRFSLNQYYWLDPMKGGLYKRTVDRAVKWSLALGMDVILDLHWTGDASSQGQRTMPNQQGLTFWQDVANTYKNDGRIIFELYNEPYGVSAAEWKNGNGSIVGMQQMYTTVRGTGANNLVLAGGLDYAYHLNDVLPSQALTGINIAYVTHPYAFKAPARGDWDTAFGNLSPTYPMVATEFGQANINEPGGTQNCDGNFYQTIINYFNEKGISWTAWAWHVERQVTNPAITCGFPQLITSYGGTPNAAGTVVRMMLGGN